MSPIKQRLLEAIEQTPESILEQTLTFLEFLISRTPAAAIAPDFDSDFDSDTDSNDRILADLKASLHARQSRKNLPHRGALGRHQCLICQSNSNSRHSSNVASRDSLKSIAKFKPMFSPSSMR
ncbi:hypothetical protein QT971_22005 [Microcoleus sp. herbarium19]|uniref:hypothetical protein n=1 Tax=unclassified Microcoleus TaxID=2642155 RepID=UPI002FD0E48C